MHFRMAAAICLLVLPWLQGCVGAALISDEHIDVRSYTFKNRSEVIATLGQPSRTNDESLVYRLQEKRMRGVIPALLVPLPLYLPVGKEEVTFHLDEGKVTGVAYRRSRVRGGFCGFVPDESTHIEFKFGCSSPANRLPAQPPL